MSLVCLWMSRNSSSALKILLVESTWYFWVEVFWQTSWKIVKNFGSLEKNGKKKALLRSEKSVIKSMHIGLINKIFTSILNPSSPQKSFFYFFFTSTFLVETFKKKRRSVITFFVLTLMTWRMIWPSLKWIKREWL